MMGSDLYFRDKIPVAVLGSTGSIGKQLVQHLAGHPWFEIVALCDSEHLIDQYYGEFVKEPFLSSLPDAIAKMQVQPCVPPLPCSLIFSALDVQSANDIEIPFAEKGYPVISCSSYPMDCHIPQIVVDVNSDHLTLMDRQNFAKGRIVATPHPIVMGLALGLKPLMNQFGLTDVQVVTLQPLLSNDNRKSLLSLKEEETRVEKECLQILGQIKSDGIQDADFNISVQCNDIPSIAETIGCVSVKLKESAKPEQLIQAWRQFAEGQRLIKLPMAPFHSLYYFNQSVDCDEQFENDSQMQSALDKQKTVRIANLRPCAVLDYKFNLFFSHPLQGIARSEILIGELLVSKGKIYW
jgi:aspartate-semialdehyde dehydrogenase